MAENAASDKDKLITKTQGDTLSTFSNRLSNLQFRINALLTTGHKLSPNNKTRSKQ